MRPSSGGDRPSAKTSSTASAKKTESMRNKRREAKRTIISLQTMMRAKDITPEDRMELSKQVFKCRMVLNQLASGTRGLATARRGRGGNSNSNAAAQQAQHLHEMDITREEIASRRRFLNDNPGLRQTFFALWMVFSPYTEAGVLTRDGYVKFQHSIHVALVGADSGFLDDVNSNIDGEYAHDITLFGELKEEAFYDLLFETIGESLSLSHSLSLSLSLSHKHTHSFLLASTCSLTDCFSVCFVVHLSVCLFDGLCGAETWSEILDPHYYAAFSWALLDSIANTATQPPKLRPLREVRCITKIENEAVRFLLACLSTWWLSCFVCWHACIYFC
jgi:hypothetical protein